jgi:hypothetical protein
LAENISEFKKLKVAINAEIESNAGKRELK